VSEISIRAARIEDAEQATLVLRRSITELCAADHGNDPADLEHWLANKTPEVFRHWLETPDTTLIVAEHDGVIAGVGGCRADGEITLNYVGPDHRSRGVSSAILAALEARLRDLGVGEAVLTSTRTAHCFYRSRGFGAADETPYEMSK